MAIKQVDGSTWPTTETSPLLLLPFHPDELAAKFGLVFTDDEDDLGPLRLAVVTGPGFGVAGLMRYRDAPFAGTTVYVDSECDLRSARDAVLREFGLAESEVSWITPNAGEATS